MTSGVKNKYVVIGLIAIHISLLVFFVFFRMVDGDESFYLSAAQQVTQGQVLYQDFFYPQMPYLPYLLSVLMGNGFDTLYLTRMISVALSILTIVIFYLLLQRLTDDRKVRYLLLGMFTFSGLIISWHSVAKTYAWTDLCMLATLYILALPQASKKFWPAAAGAAMMALAFNIRLVLAPIAFLFLLQAIYVSQKNKAKVALTYLTWFAAVSLPTIILFFSDIKRFLFNNLGYHLIRNSNIVFPESITERAITLVRSLLDPQKLILVAICILAFILWLKARRATAGKSLFVSTSGMAAIIAVTLAVVYLIPDPIHHQYIEQAIPFALLASTKAMEYLVGRGREVRFSRMAKRISIIFAVIYIMGITPYIIIFTGNVREADRSFKINVIKEVCESINNSNEVDSVFSELPIFTVLTETAAFRLVEHIGWEYPLPLTIDQKKYYKLATYDYLRDILGNKRASHYIVINDPPEELAPLAQANYELVEKIDRFKIYRRRL